MLRESEYPEELRRLLAERTPQSRHQVRLWKKRRTKAPLLFSLAELLLSGSEDGWWVGVYAPDAQAGDKPILVVPVLPDQPQEADLGDGPELATVFGTTRVGYPLLIDLNGRTFRPAGPALPPPARSARL